ncbi:UTP--glucose-1-phosphate uridylyltransferase GalU [Oharaeibacter diazotrophicus]|uniref:UTP--glucose-1-phosphate uridylyltransferase n=1 Tax=Oharaeibacter diazotrophicus TaxID=1920512 RepID=A0A4R6RFN8_9HYPH|nr:UTP--glucose-1-phosphate uridylyltransferase GalU [Oharaeibacter diazotrophicus]TDP84915.1 UTP--glucose-1-phosphate uridylyltransferase [Oharaeibacter diazotrophicus]BBE73886.1 UTP-glucose-1-phosphate uridylyltransferase [Pleomorphomonas sp. SM30]GLS76429.1 UTP--glucose-1-phosphate uridylyltransferase [Oharaeibacter diazotrophicus]
MSQKIRKAVFPVAGLGTRFLPATKAVPKEMMTIVDRPALQYVVDEAKAAGIEHFVFVTGRGKAVIEDHFDIAYELEDTLRGRNKNEALDILKRDLPTAGSVSFTRQQAPLGLGHAVWCAREIVGDEPFAVLLPDMLMKHDTPCLKSMVDAYAKTGGNVLSLEACEPAQTSSYGIVGLGATVSDDVHEITGMVEKPKPADAPSNLFISGRYILQPEIFDLLGNQEKGAGGEIQLTDAMLRLLKHSPFYGVRFRGTTYDTGSKIGFLQANLAYALDRTDIHPDIRSELAAVLDKA